jgi:2-dehydro-3-deoxygluconokinase
MTELVTFGETALRLSAPGSMRLETTDRLDVWAAGAESNVAVAASRLGTDAMWTTKMADTPLGRRAVAELRGHGLTTEVNWVDDGDVRQGLTFFESGNEPRDDFVLDDRQRTAIESVEPGELPMSEVQQAEAVFVSGETVALSETALETIQAVLRAAGGKAVLGMDYRSDLWSKTEARETLTDIFPAVDVLVANERDVSSVLKKQGNTKEIAHQVASEYDFETVVITKSEHGAIAWHNATIHEHDAVETETVDATGQHDALVGAFLSRRLAGDDVGGALAYGIAAAALTRTMPGPIPTITASEVETIVDELDAGSPGGAGGPLR